MDQKAPRFVLKRLAGFFHFVFACIALIGIGFLYLNSNYGRGLDWITSETYEQSPDFNKKVQNDITSIFDYIQYQEIFETNGEVDYTKKVLELTDGPGGDKTYTLNDIILYGKSLGYYLDENDNYALKGGPETLTEEESEQYYVRWRCYQSEEELTGPDQSFSTLPQLTYEILRRYSSYYSIYSRLMSDFTNFYFRIAFYSKNSAIYEIHTNASEMSIDDMMAMGKYIYYAGDSNDLTVRTNFNSTFPSVPSLMAKCNPYTGNLTEFFYLDATARQTDRIYETIERLASGETDYKVEVSGFFSLESKLAEGLNRISDGLQTALAEQVKSERLKADLITNVSHDIKTPLTSIINYVDLIKREHPEDPTIQRYLEILDQKSQRLKTLTEDLVEASRASSGNIKLEMAHIDIVELVQQTNGEFEEKYALRHLDIVTSLPNEVIMIEADGRRLWRVLENLYNNAFKYALEGTRVYVGIEDQGSEVVFSIKNVSSSPLNISPDELTERFVRGDTSRTTEGSGLGLSIAKDLTTLQGGKFQITIDGDLFKAEITFPITN